MYNWKYKILGKVWITSPSICIGLFILFSLVCNLVKLYFWAERVSRVQNIGDSWTCLNVSEQLELAVSGNEKVIVLEWSLGMRRLFFRHTQIGVKHKLWHLFVRANETMFIGMFLCLWVDWANSDNWVSTKH